MPTDTQYYFIISKAIGPNGEIMVLSLEETNTNAVLAVHNYLDPKQMWEKRPRVASNPGVFGLVNKATGQCIMRASRDNGASIRTENVGAIGINDLAAWQDDTVQGPYNALVSLQDWEQKLNIMGDGPYVAGSRIISWEWSRGADNELWRFQSANSTARLVRIDFDLAAGRITDLGTSIVTQQTINNVSDLEQSQSLTYEAKESKSETYSASAALELSVQHTVEVGAPVGFKTSLQLGAKVTTTLTFGQTMTKEETITLTTPVRVPARSSVTVKVVVRRGQIDVPFTAVYEVTYADGRVVEVRKSGVYNQVSAYDVHTSIEAAVPLGPSPLVGSTLEISNFAHLKQIGVTWDRQLYMTTNRAAYERWTVEDAGNGQVYLRSAAHGSYLGSNDARAVYATNAAGEWERWLIVTVAEGVVLIRSVKWGLHLGALPEGALYTHPNTYEWERWRLRKV